MCTLCSHLRIKTGGGARHKEGGDSPMKMETAPRGWEEGERVKKVLDTSCEYFLKSGAGMSLYLS